MTDAGEAAAHQLVTGLEQFDGAIAHSMGSSPAFEPSGGPLRIYLFRSEHEFAEFRNDGWAAGLTISPGNRAAPFIVLFQGPITRETAIHEYVHALVRRGDWKLPLWFEEGLAEVYARSEPAGRDRLTIGRRIPEHLAQLNNQTLTPSMFLEEPLPATRLRYYAASWALVHMLLMEPGFRAMTEQLLAAGTWDASFPELLKDLQAYVARPIWKEATVNAPRPLSVDLTVKTIAPLDVEFMLAALLLDASRPEAARKRYRKIAAAHPRDASGAEASGFSALADGQMDVARKEFRRALNLKSARARVWWELASIDQEAGVPWIEVKTLLERAANLDPNDSQAAFRLGVRESDDGELGSAIVHLGAAARAVPGQADVWHAYALALAKAGRFDEARTAAKRALRVASSPEWERMASDLVASLDHPEASRPAVRRKPEVVTSPAWNRPSPDAEVEGRFLEFICDANPPRLRIEVEGGKVLELRVSNPAQVTILSPNSGESSMELKCGLQNRRPIRAGFRKSDGTVLELKFPQVHDSPRF